MSFGHIAKTPAYDRQFTIKWTNLWEAPLHFYAAKRPFQHEHSNSRFVIISANFALAEKVLFSFKAKQFISDEHLVCPNCNSLKGL